MIVQLASRNREGTYLDINQVNSTQNLQSEREVQPNKKKNEFQQTPK